MKRIYALSLALVSLAGCTPELLTSTATQATLEAENAKAMDRQLKAASESLAKVNLQRAIDTFNAENGHFPATLAELVPSQFQVVPNHADGTPFAYDPTTGKVLDGPVAPAPPGPTAADGQKIEQIRAAIDKYGRAVGYYPPSLQALVPTYLAAVPKTDSGQDFLFDPQNGNLAHPSQPQPAPQVAGQPQAAPRPGAGGGGAGPMGEAMTGIAMQNQLNSMGGSATNAAGSYARQGIGGVTDQHNQQQEKAMDQLGL